MTTSHLSEIAAAKLELSDADRIRHIKKERWIPYERARDITSRLEDLLDHPTQPRMPNMLIAGETNNGKTMLIRKFLEKHPATEGASGDHVSIPVLCIQAPPTPDERGLYGAILTRVFESQRRRNEPTDVKREQVLEVLRRTNVRMFMLDELHHLLAGAYTKQRTFLNVLKYLGNELCIPIVGVGTAEAIRAIQSDPQLANRFTPELLPKWRMDAELARLLASFEHLLPLREPSGLTSKALASIILAMSGGTIGEISAVLNSAAIHAIRSKAERITPEVLKGCGYVPPQSRKQAATTL